MGYNELMISKVRQVFNLIGNLAINVTLTQKATTSYDFAEASNVVSAPITKVIKGIEDKNGKKKADTATITKEMTFKSEDLPDPDIYDYLVMPDGTSWRFIPPYENDGYLIKVTLSKEPS